MGSFILTVICLSLVGSFNFLSPLVEAQGTANPEERRPPPPPPDQPPPPPPSSSPPPPPLQSPPPPPSPSPPPPPSSPPPPTPRSPPPPSPRPPPPPKRYHSIPRPPHHPEKDSTHGIARSQGKQTLNLGKKIGLMFAGIAMIMQVCVVAFLIIKRRRLLKSERY